MNAAQMTPAAKAYVHEYGRMPRGPEETDLWNAFRHGFDAGKTEGRMTSLRRAAQMLFEQAEAIA